MNKKIQFVLLFILTIVFNNSWSQKLTEQQKDSMLTTYISVPNSTIKIIPPAYFKPFTNDGKFGFMHVGASSTISFKVIPGTPYLMNDEFSKLIEQSFEKQGVKLVSSENVKTKAGKDGKMYVVSFKAKSKDGKQEYDYERLMLFTGDLSQTIWIEANYPTVVKKILFDVLKLSLLTVQF